MDARVLILVFDLHATVLDFLGEHPIRRPDVLFALGHGIAHAPHLQGEVARRLRRQVEMLVEHLVGRRIDHAMSPVGALEFLVSFVPEQRITTAGNGENDHPVHVAVRLLVGTGRHFRAMAADGPFRQDEAQIAAAGAAGRHRLQLKTRKVGNEVGLPLVAPLEDFDIFAFPGEIIGAAKAVGEAGGIVPDKGFVAKQIDQMRQIVGCTQARGLLPRPIEVAITGVEGNRKQAFRTPFETVGSRRGFHRGRTVP